MTLNLPNLPCQKQFLKSAEALLKITEIVIGFSSWIMIYFGQGKWLACYFFWTFGSHVQLYSIILNRLMGLRKYFLCKCV